RQPLLEQLLGHAFPQDSEGSFGNNFSNGSGDGFGYRVFRSTRLGSGTLQQIGKKFSLWHAEDALVAQQGAGETIDHLSCCHWTLPEQTHKYETGQSGKRRGLQRSKKQCEREVLNEGREWNLEEKPV